MISIERAPSKFEIGAERTLKEPCLSLKDIRPNLIKPEGAPIKPEGALIKPEGAPIKPEGAPIKPEGAPIKPEGVSTYAQLFY